MDLLNMSSKTPFSDWVKKEVAVNRRNVNILITGRTQIRKSTIALKLALQIQPDFDMEKQMGIIKAEEYLKVLNIKGRRGDVLFLDEFGVGMDHRSWHSFLNKAMNYIIQTYGHEGRIVLVTAPYADYVDTDAKKMFDVMIEILKKNDTEKYVIAKIEMLQYNQKLKKMYHKFFRGKVANGKIKRIDAWKIGYPTKDMLKRYFALANASKEFLKQELEMASKEISKVRKRGAFSVDDAAQKIVDEIDDGRIREVMGRFIIADDIGGWRIKKYHNRLILNKEDVINKLSLGEPTAMRVKAKAEELLNAKIQKRREAAG